jgi:hypothetical protein
VQAIKYHLEGKLLLEGRAMTDERDKHIKALMQRLTAQHREADRRETHRAAGGRAGEGPGSKLTWSPPFTV